MSVECFVGLVRRVFGVGSVIAIGCAAPAPSAHAEIRFGATYPAQIAGHPRVVDGDTIVIDGNRIRLEGIDAPETGQPCGRADGRGDWDCGAAATHELKAIIAGRPVVCENRGTDKYRRMLGRCLIGGLDINAELVRRGYAWAFVRYSRVYVAEEGDAQVRKVGVWQGAAMAPWDYRRSQWETEAAQAPGGCAIKGNVSAGGRIYHMPWSPHYGRVKLDSGAGGKRWFCSEEEAQAAGWRAAKAW
jgi:endonuclease YncB( thermonuclease family)